MAITLKELSGLLGLSQTTVSRALNGYPEVKEATRLRIVKAAQDHQYVPNPRARGLATGCAMAIGHVLPLTEKTEMVNPIFSDFPVWRRRGLHQAWLWCASELSRPGKRDRALSLADPATDGRWRDPARTTLRR